MWLGAVAHLPNEGAIIALFSCILKFVHCYSKDVVSTKVENKELGTSMGNGKIKQNNETENWK